MKLLEIELPGPKLIDSEVFSDHRGSFCTLYSENNFLDLGIDTKFCQDSYSISCRGTLRGLHYQNPLAQGKIVAVLRGKIWDVVLDIRTDSINFARWTGIFLSANSGQHLWIPPGFAHGFQVVSDEDAIVAYKLTEHRHAPSEGIISWDDSVLGIDWPIKNPILSDRDSTAQDLANAINLPKK
tara:strand:+ start:390 stop:938 length:549 start_codon:yes stop_codon:yes gene_type:complete